MRRLTHSLRLRLILGFILLITITWICASLLALHQIRKNVDELFDTQQMLFAKRLTALNISDLTVKTPQLPRSKKIIRHNRGDLDDDALAFAIFTTDGKMVLNDGDNGPDLQYHYQQDGFSNGTLQGDKDLWRLVWLTTPDGKYRVVVGQEWDYRQDMAIDIVKAQLLPWVVALPIMVLLLIWLVTRELAPLKRLAKRLHQHQPEDETPLPLTSIPSEVKPLVEALNSLFARTGDMLVRERRFTADAAHELRSPLAALKVQTEVAQLAQDDPEMREHALSNLTEGIDRATRLVDQLLTLSRLDSLSGLDDVQEVALQDLLQTAVMDNYHKARANGVELMLEIRQTPPSRRAQPLLLALLVRNLLDNAIRYSPRGSSVKITLDAHAFSVEDNGLGISPEYLQRVGERFFRPPGQEKTGSGLGLSIVQRIAVLHGMTTHFSHGESGGFRVEVRW
ncbi:quorum sensing histidine kinase QseC [Yersinia mollaretii]|uniref:quorum sensing histidine kinase QseC n=1 Tax=Yersinia mollaretii TaxID=33060 RepID=UPI0005E73D27|nr:quorum sensing histidine kinase QseC [Yersinia mollaretii]MDA5526856.1 two-component system sensor histidine kinase QseC [Yersinia mollaretii]MDR7872250.1 quorum sensing histidine kinase QseC [Yersinia mollaretii]PHZ31711.1 two-component system sensor histidine kinase QseC [Yersinia mollaretii]WQC73232.1 quorum sensing histidine kinase QseC [Yersinia mollaretii]CNE62561.1 sensor protein BasS/PmrB [Yersinia mollaretii]